VRTSGQEQQYWVIQPLIDAGVELEEIRSLLLRLAFEAAVTEGRGTVAGVSSVVRDQPVGVRAAWAEVIGRMLTFEDRGSPA
jgi:hypothetical protein